MARVSIPIDGTKLSQLKNVRADLDRMRPFLPNPSDFTDRNHEYIGLSPVETKTGDFIQIEHQCLWQWWQDRYDPENDTLPLTSDFTPTDVKQALGVILLIEPKKDYQDFHYRVYGSRIAQVIGRDMTGKWLSEFPDGPSNSCHSQYETVCNNRFPAYSEHDASPDVSNLVRWCRLMLPLQNGDGAIDRLLVGNVPVDCQQSMRTGALEMR